METVVKKWNRSDLLKNSVYSRIPRDIWKMLICIINHKCTALLSQTCHKLKELTRGMQDVFLKIARDYRRADRIPLALRFLLKSVAAGSTEAMFHIGFAREFPEGGWGLKQDNEKSVLWLKKAAEAGNESAMVLYADCIRLEEADLYQIWRNKALSTNDPVVVTLDWYLRAQYEDVLFEQISYDVKYLMHSCATTGNEYAQYILGYFYERLDNEEAARMWYTNAAVQGFCSAQYELLLLLNAEEENEWETWEKKAENQNVY